MEPSATTAKALLAAILGALANIFVVNLDLVLLLCVVVLFDMLAVVASSMRLRKTVAVRVLLRDFVWELFGYLLLLFAAVGIANAASAGSSWVSQGLSWVGEFTFFFICIVELKSIALTLGLKEYLVVILDRLKPPSAP